MERNGNTEEMFIKKRGITKNTNIDNRKNKEEIEQVANFQVSENDN